jgi:hypothetical protein
MISKNKNIFIFVIMFLLIIISSVGAFASICDSVYVDTIGETYLTSTTATLNSNIILPAGVINGYTGTRYRLSGSTEWFYTDNVDVYNTTEYYFHDVDDLIPNSQYEEQAYFIAGDISCTKYDSSPNTFTTREYTYNSDWVHPSYFSDDYLTSYAYASYGFKSSTPETAVVSKIIYNSYLNNITFLAKGEGSYGTPYGALYIKEFESSSWVSQGSSDISTLINLTYEINKNIYAYKIALTTGAYSAYYGTYTVKLYNINADITPAEPIIGEGSISSISYNNANLLLNLSSIGGYTPVNVGINISKYYSNIWGDMCESSTTTKGLKSCSLYSLDSDTLYYYYPYVDYVKDGSTIRVQYPYTQTFLTNSEEPELYLNDVSNLKYNSVTLNGRVSSSGSVDALNCIFQIAEYNNGDYSFDYLSGSTTVYSYTTKPKALSQSVTALLADTTYAYSFDCFDVSNNNKYYPEISVKTFTTDEIPLDAPQYDFIDATNIKDDSVTLSLILTANITYPVGVTFGYKEENASSFTFKNVELESGTLPYTVSINPEILPNSTYEYYVIIYYDENFAEYLTTETREFTSLETPAVIPAKTVADYFDIFTSGSSLMKLIVAIVLIIGLFMAGFTYTNTIIAGVIFGFIGLVLSIALKLISVWVLIVLGIAIIAPFLFILMFGRRN